MAETEQFITQHPKMLEILELIDTIAQTQATVLITGESGTGKSLIARMIHRQSPRRNKPFIEVSCGALPETLLESELFGHVKGAFTGATTNRIGKFAAAEGGTIFLDEISSASPALQLKLLRVLEEQRFEPVGSNETVCVDVRIIAATNRNLWEDVEANLFRRDLYYRINVININLPPLRQRWGDIALLANYFLHRYAKQYSKRILGFTDAALAMLEAYHWPGNVRELANCIERAVLLCQGHQIDVSLLPSSVVEGAKGLSSDAKSNCGYADTSNQSGRFSAASSGAAVASLAETLAETEKRIIRAALAAHGGSRQATAKALGINRCTLYKKLKKYGLLK